MVTLLVERKAKPGEPSTTVIDMQPTASGTPLDKVNERFKIRPQGHKPLSRTSGSTRNGSNARIQDVGNVMNAMQRLMRMNQQVVKRRMDRVGRSLLMLKSMAPTVTLSSHEALVRHMQFSPDGEHLATCR